MEKEKRGKKGGAFPSQRLDSIWCAERRKLRRKERRSRGGRGFPFPRGQPHLKEREERKRE